jgi:hypothetical protein
VDAVMRRKVGSWEMLGKGPPEVRRVDIIAIVY